MDAFNDFDRGKTLVTDTLAANPLVIKDPAPTTVVAELKEYAVVLRVRAYVRRPDYWAALYGLQKDVQHALRANDVPIAVTHQAPVNRSEVADGITASGKGRKNAAAANPMAQKCLTALCCGLAAPRRAKIAADWPVR